MVRHLARLIWSAVLAAAAVLLGGCVLAKLNAGFTLAPPGVYLTIEGVSQDPPQTQPVKIIAVEIPSTTMPAATSHD